MPTPTLRPMTADDVEPAAEMILRNDWGVRHDWLRFATTQPQCTPLVAEADGTVVAAGVGTANGRVGWVGTIFVDPGWRGRGLGRSITEAIVDALEEGGCRTLVLVATSEGRRLYERMGFEVQTTYRILQAIGLPPAPAVDSVRAFRPVDLAAIAELDREGTGEDRGYAIARFATPESAWVDATDEGIQAFVVRAPWGGGATVARSPEAALRIVRARRLAAGVGGRVSVGLADENADGLARLRDVGFRLRWSAPRMIRGAAMTWRPDWIWGQFNHAMG